MVTTLILCPKCRRTLSDERLYHSDVPLRCPGCEDPLQIEIFPAFFQSNVIPVIDEAALLEGNSTCYYHANRKAMLPCEACGRFLCSLCDCELNGRHLCPLCLESGRKKGKIKNLEHSRQKWDNIALALTVIPVASLVLWGFSLITAPISIFIAIRYWNAPRSIFHRTRFRLILAIVLDVLVMIGWIAFFVYVLSPAIRNARG